MGFIKGVWRLLKRCYVLGYNRKKNIFGMNPLLISTFFIILTATLASMFRMVVKKSLGDGIVKQIILEFIATAELCAICFELVIVADNYGCWMYALFLFLLTMWWARVWEIESACPYSEMEKVVEGTQEATKAVLVIVAQILGGMLIYFYVQLLWSMELTETHRGKVQEECKADLQKSLKRRILTEILGTFISTFPKRYLVKCYQPYAVIFCILWDITFSLLTNILAVGVVFMNSAIATCFCLKCVPLKDIIVAYWFGSNFGAVMAFLLIQRVKCSGRSLPRNVSETSDQNSVSAAVGTFVEGAGTCICRMASRLLNDSNARFASIADPFFATMMVVAAFNYSGGYFNPALATSLKAGCDGHTLVEFMVVYWFGASAGAIASIYIYRSDSFKQFAERIKPKTE